MNRRGFLQGILAAGVAPAIIPCSSLMKVWVPSERKILRTPLSTHLCLMRAKFRQLDGNSEQHFSWVTEENVQRFTDSGYTLVYDTDAAIIKAPWRTQDFIVKTDLLV